MKKLIALFTAVIMLAALTSGCSKTTAAADDQTPEKYTPVQVETVVKKPKLANVETISGKVVPDQELMIMPKVQMPTKVTSVKVKVGDSVRKGALLFTLDSGDIQDQVDQAKAMLDFQEANYQRTKEQIDSAKSNLEKYKALYEAGGISKADLEKAELAASDSSLDAAEAQLNQSKVGYNQALDALKNSSVTSPINGIVSAVNVQAGGMAMNTQPAASVVAVDKVYVTVSITENIINQLKKGQEVKVSVPAASSKEFSGKIDTISPVSDNMTQLYQVKVAIDNKDGLIKPGMFAKADLETNIRKDVIAVKSEAVVVKNGKPVVYVVEGDKAVEKGVTLGLDAGEYVEILKGLNPNEKLIVVGQNYVEDGAKVKVVGGIQS